MTQATGKGERRMNRGHRGERKIAEKIIEERTRNRAYGRKKTWERRA